MRDDEDEVDERDLDEADRPRELDDVEGEPEDRRDELAVRVFAFDDEGEDARLPVLPDRVPERRLVEPRPGPDVRDVPDCRPRLDCSRPWS